MRNNATSVVESRPASCAATISPPGSVTASSPSSDKASSAVTISPGRQTKPLDRDRCELDGNDARRNLGDKASERSGQVLKRRE